MSQSSDLVPVPQPPVPAPRHKNPSTALFFEIFPPFFGFFGLGWLYAGNTTVGLVLLIGGWAWTFVVVGVAIVTLSVSILCSGPFSLFGVIVSAFFLHQYMADRPEQFGKRV